jgi:hypothetical protein
VVGGKLQLTIADWLVEVHDVHHPISTALYYEDQKPESARRVAGAGGRVLVLDGGAVRVP